MRSVSLSLFETHTCIRLTSALPHVHVHVYVTVFLHGTCTCS